MTITAELLGLNSAYKNGAWHNSYMPTQNAQRSPILLSEEHNIAISRIKGDVAILWQVGGEKIELP